jgi:hypothetical protein
MNNLNTLLYVNIKRYTSVLLQKRNKVMCKN